MAAKTVRAGVVGVGYLGRIHAEKYQGLDGVELVGVVDTDADRAAEVAAACGTTAFPSLDALIEAGIDAASVVVPTTGHHEVGTRLLDAGVDVLVEKPITVTLEEADDLIARAAKGNRILQVGHLERFNPALTNLADEIADPMFIEAHRLAQFGERGTEVDVVLDLMIHDLDIVLWAVRDSIAQISAVGIPVLTDKIDIANVRLEFEGGCVANLTASRVSMQRMRKVRLFQANGYFSLDFQTRKANVVRRRMDPEKGPTISGAEIDLEQTDALAEELRAFAHAVRTRETPVVTGEDGRAALDVAVRIGAAIKKRLTDNADRLPAAVLEKISGQAP